MWHLRRINYVPEGGDYYYYFPPCFRCSFFTLSDELLSDSCFGLRFAEMKSTLVIPVNCQEIGIKINHLETLDLILCVAEGEFPVG